MQDQVKELKYDIDKIEAMMELLVQDITEIKKL
jgi:hypothetical protein